MGSLRQVGPTRWELFVSTGRDPFSGRYGRRTRTVTASGKRAAKGLLRVFEDEVTQSALEGGSGTLFRQVGDLWLVWAQTNHASTTFYCESQLYKGRVLPRWGATPLSEITALALEHWYETLREEGLGPGTVRQIHSQMASILKRAVKANLIAHRATTEAEVGSAAPPDIQPPTPQEVDRLLAAADVETRMFIYVSCLLGARRGSTVALLQSDLALDRNEIRISSALVKVPGQAMELKGTKTGAKLWLSIDDDAVAAFRNYREWQERRGPLVEDPFLFFQNVGSRGSVPWSPTMASAKFREVRERANLPHVTLKNLRHFSASQLVAAGVDIVTVAGRLGHANPSTTLRFYAKFDREADKRAAKVIGGIVKLS